jgi:hypothetical protein
MNTTMRRLLGMLLAVILLAAACGDDSGSDGDSASDDGGGGASGILRVPDDYDTIQAAVDAAEPGSMVLVSEGTYEEEVNVTTDGLTIRGMDRNEVILEGGFEKENGIRILEADGVVVENMTAQNYTRNGFFWTGVDGYRGSYLTAIRNGDYGVYAFGSLNGQLDNSYGSGSPDAGVYIGQCYKCNAVVDNFVSEYNGLGYSGTDSGGDLYIVNSTFRFNRGGVVPNSGTYEGCSPETETTMVGNLIHDNGTVDTSAIDIALLAHGVGITTAGGNGNVIERNRVQGHEFGIAVNVFPEDDPIHDLIDVPEEGCQDETPPLSEEELADVPNPLIWPTKDNRVIGNVVTDSSVADIIVVSTPEDGNCLADNEATTYSPEGIEDAIPCDGELGDFQSDNARFAEVLSSERPPSVPYEDVELPDPGDLETMEDPEGTPYEPFTGPEPIDLDAIEVPPPPE